MNIKLKLQGNGVHYYIKLDLLVYLHVMTNISSEHIICCVCYPFLNWNYENLSLKSVSLLSIFFIFCMSACLN